MNKLIVGDIHGGIRGDSTEFHKAHKDLFKHLATVCYEHKVDEVYILGDLWNSRTELNVKTLQEIMDAVDSLANSVRVVILTGNHDVFYKNNNSISALTVFRHTPNVRVISEITECQWFPKQNVILVPWLVDQDEIVEYLKGKKGYRAILGHFDFVGGLVSKGHSSSSGLDHLVIEKACDNIFSGHYHLNRWMSKKTCYVGSAMQLNWGDAGEKKLFYLVSEDGIETIENTISPQFENVTISGLKKSAAQYKIAGNYVKLVIDEKVPETTIRKLISLLEGKGPLGIQLVNELDEEPETTEATESVSKIGDPLVLVKDYMNSMDIEKGMRTRVDKELDKLYLEASTL